MSVLYDDDYLYIAVDVADAFNHAIRKVTPTGAVTTLAGLAGSFGSADGIGNAARFTVPKGVAVDSAGNGPSDVLLGAPLTGL